jgi:hypothetical protein
VAAVRRLLVRDDGQRIVYGLNEQEPRVKNSVRALIVGLCVGSPVVFAQPTGTPAAPAATPAPAKAAEKAGEVKLVEAGAEPRRQLRYKAVKGDKFGFEMRMKMSMSTKMDGNEMPSPAMPTMVMGGNAEIVEVAPGGNATMRFVYAEGKLADTEGVMEQVVAAMEAPMAQLKGISGEFVFSPRGECVSGSFKVPEDADAMVKQTLDGMNKSMQQLTVPLPEEAVGKGAKWTCERLQDTNGVKVNAHYTQELTELMDKGFTAKMGIKGDAPEQTVQGMKLESMKMLGDGTMRVDFARMMPVDCRVASTVDTTMSVPGQGKITMSMLMTMSMKQTEPSVVKPEAAKPEPAKPDGGKGAPKF